MIKLNIPPELKRKIKDQGCGRIIAIYDNEGETLDRYSVYFNTYATDHDMSKDVFVMSEIQAPNTVAMWSSGITGRHNGKSIPFDKLPGACQQAIINQFNE